MAVALSHSAFNMGKVLVMGLLFIHLQSFISYSVRCQASLLLQIKSKVGWAGGGGGSEIEE